MPSVDLSDCLLWFAHCPKAGGTSVEQAMVAEWGSRVGYLHWGWDLWWHGGGWRTADPPNSPQHLTWEDACRLLPRPPDKSFALVRDPVARMASEHRWQRRGRRGTWLGRILARLPFSIWLRVMFAITARNPYAFDNHFRAQSDFVPDAARVFRLEDGMGPVQAWLDNVTTGRGPVIPHAIATGKSSPVSKNDCARIAVRYARDYRRFGYAMPSGEKSRDAMDYVIECLAPVLAFLERRGRI